MPKYVVELQKQVVKYYLTEVEIEANSEDEVEAIAYSLSSDINLWEDTGEEDSEDVLITDIWEK